MTDQVQDVAPSSEESVLAAALSEPKLWAGKYKSPEEMENAIKGKDQEYTKLMSETNELKQKVEHYSKVPEEYKLPEGVALRDHEAREIADMARKAGLTQDHFEKMAREMDTRIRSNITSLDEAKKSIGDEKLAIITDHVKKYYPEKLHQTIINQTLKDKGIMEAIMSERDTKLNSQAPGMNQAGQGARPTYDGQGELEKAAKEYAKQPNERNRQKYINLAREVGDERYKDKVAG